MLSLPGILLGVMLSAATLHAQDTVRYTIVMAKGPAGYTKAWTDASGARHYYTEWNDRGRGPAISQTVVLGADGFPVRMDITGVDYLKSPVEEHYLAETVTQAGTPWHAAWRNDAESTTVARPSPAYYLAMNDISIDVFEPLLFKAQRLALLPQGQAPREIRSVVIYLQGMPSTPVPPKRYELRQEGEVFLPHVLPVARGASIDFTNGDPFYHNVFSLSRAGTFDLGRFPRGQSRDRQFTASGLVKVFCHLHSDMSAVIMVLDHPWFTTPQDDGGFVLENVPAGKRTIAAWHERVGEAKVGVNVPADGEATVEFVLPAVES